MPPPLTTAQRATIAAGKAIGARPKEIARRAGVSMPTVRKYALEDPGTRNMMREVKYHFAPEIIEIVRKSLKSLEKDLETAKTLGERIKLREEVLRLLAYGEMATATQTTSTAGVIAAPGAGQTLGDILQQYAQQTTTQQVTVHGPPQPAQEPGRIESAIDSYIIDNGDGTGTDPNA